MTKFANEFWDWPPETQPRQRREYRAAVTLTVERQMPSLYLRFCRAYANFLFFVLKWLALAVLGIVSFAFFFVLFTILKVALSQ